MRRLFLISVFVMAVCLMANALAQEVHQGEIFTLSDELLPGQCYRYTASNHIELLPGFLTEPTGRDSSVLDIDPYGVFPPEEGFTGGPVLGNNGVVGTLGGTFDVGAMGAAIYTIPLDFPAGINGMQPNLAITYNSQGGNGLMGWGWGLTGLSSIERTGKTLYHDGVMTAADLSNNDRFLLDGQRLVAVSHFADSTEYRTEHDGMSRIRSYIRREYPLLPGSNIVLVVSHFKVWRPDGLVMEYGATESSWINAQDSCQQALCWLLDKVTDRNGNSVTYHYYEDVQKGEFHIDTILYTVNEIQEMPAQFAVTFEYDTNRQDEERYYIGGNQIFTGQRLEAIKVSSKEDGRPLLKYDFTYDYNSKRGYNILKTILKTAYGPNGAIETINPTTIGWDTSNPEAVVPYTISNPNIFNGAFPFTGDFNGDGYTDVALVPYKDSTVYHSPVDIEVYLNDRDYSFEHVSSMDLTGMPVTLDWIHVLDINGDGLDDLVPLFYDSLPWPSNECTLAQVYLNQPSSQSFNLIGSRLIQSKADVITGDFDGNGTSDVILLQKKDKNVNYGNNGSNSAEAPHVKNAYFLGFQGTQFLSRKLNHDSMENLGPVFNPVAADFDGDGRTEALFVGPAEYPVNNTLLGWFDLSDSLDCFKVKQCLSESFYPHQSLLDDSPWCHVFPGDYNGDGKADLLYCLSGYWKICLSEGDKMGASFSVSSSATFPTFHHFINIFYPSLRLLTHSMLGNYSATLVTGDFDGDGCTDVCYTLATDSPLFFQAGLRKSDATTMRFRKQVNTPNNMRFSSQFIHTGNFLGQGGLSLLGSTQASGNPSDTIFGIHALNAVPQYNSVTSVTDGLGNSIYFTYDWLMPEASGTTDPFYSFSYAAPDNYGMCPVPLTARALRSVRVSGVNNSSEITRYSYHNAMYHRYGHGFIGFRKTVAETFRNSTGTPWKTRKTCWYETTTMGGYATMLPQCDTTWVNSGSGSRMVGRTHYTFENAVFSSGVTDLVVCPAMTSRSAQTFSMDADNEPTGSENTEYLYSYSQSHTYNNTYGCTSSTRTVTGYDNGIPRCELQTAKTMGLQTIVSSWIVNRPYSEAVTTTRNNESVSSKTVYTYLSSGTYLPDTVTVIPNDGSNPLDPLTLSTAYDYDGYGNVTGTTVSAPYGIQGETARTTGYEYGAVYQHRLLTKETAGDPAAGYVTTYRYDFHDRLDTVTDCNGKKTLFATSVLGTDRNTFPPNGTERRSLTLWAFASPYSPEGASYYTWEKSTGGVTAMTFHHKSSAVLRSVTFDFLGNPVFTDRRYNTEGLLEKESLPYRMGTDEREIQWTEYHYDIHDRVDRVNSPDGLETTMSYNGLCTSTTTTPPQGSPDMTPRCVSKRLNAMGWTMESVDAGGTSVFYEYRPDGSLEWTRIGTDESTRISMEYDHVGNRTRLHDPDYCTDHADLVSVYDAFGQEVSRTTPRQLTTEFTYDFLGRTTSRVEQDVDANGTEVSRTTSWQYGETVPQKGLLLSVTHPEQTLTYTYDTCQRIASETVQFPSANPYMTQYTYDRASRIASVTYPSGFMVRQRYNASGHPTVQTDASGRELYRTCATTPMGQPEHFTLGGVLTNTLDYDPDRHLVTRIKTKRGVTTVQNLLYSYDGFCNLATRKDVARNMEERFFYDSYDRLTEVRLDGVCTGTTVYDTYGRMTSKTAGSQPVFSGAVYDVTSKPHAMDKAVTPTGEFPSAPQTVTYTGFDKVLKVKQGSDSLVYGYGYDHQRIAMEKHVGNTVRTKRYVGSCEYVTETTGNNSTSQCFTYLTGPTGIYAVVETENGTNTVHYIVKDNLGSWTVVADSIGKVEQRLSYDAWGNLRNSNTWSGSYTGSPMFYRGFTGHEHLTSFGLINMNGRMYDPMISSFLSVDQYVQGSDNSQGFNRYAYCMNNPLRYIDPSGWKMKPTPGRTSNSNDYYRDIYTYVERAYEWRDLCAPGVRSEVATAILSSFMYGNSIGVVGGITLGDDGKINDIDIDFSFKFSYEQLNKAIPPGTKGVCVITGLGSTCRFWNKNGQWGDGTLQWLNKSIQYVEQTGNDYSDPKYLVDFIEWNNAEYSFKSYEAAFIPLSEIPDAILENYVVAACSELKIASDILYNQGEKGHFANVKKVKTVNGSIELYFIEPYGTNIMSPFKSSSLDYFKMPDNLYSLSFIKYKLKP